MWGSILRPAKWKVSSPDLGKPQAGVLLVQVSSI